MCEQCGLSVVGLERETDRLISAGKREHFEMQDEQSCDLLEMSCDLQDSSCDSKASSQCDDWSSVLAHLLPVGLKHPFHVSAQLNVDTTPRCVARLSQLLLHLRGKLCTHSSM